MIVQVRACSWIVRKMRPSSGSANRVTSGLPLFPVAEVSGNTIRSQPASAASAIRLRWISRLCSRSVCRTSTWVAATLKRSTSVELRSIRLARHDDDVVALFGRRDRPDDTDDPGGPAQDQLRLPVGALEEVDAPDRLVHRDPLTQVDERLEETGLGREQVVVELGRHQEHLLLQAERRARDDLALERAEAAQNVP